MRRYFWNKKSPIRIHAGMRSFFIKLHISSFYHLRDSFFSVFTRKNLISAYSHRKTCFSNADTAVKFCILIFSQNQAYAANCSTWKFLSFSFNRKGWKKIWLPSIATRRITSLWYRIRIFHVCEEALLLLENWRLRGGEIIVICLFFVFFKTFLMQLSNMHSKN